jgi:hypothetical protein
MPAFISGLFFQLGYFRADVFQHMTVQRKFDRAEWAFPLSAFDKTLQWMVAFAPAERASNRQLGVFHPNPPHETKI